MNREIQLASTNTDWQHVFQQTHRDINMKTTDIRSMSLHQLICGAGGALGNLRNSPKLRSEDSRIKIKMMLDRIQELDEASFNRLQAKYREEVEMVEQPHTYPPQEKTVEDDSLLYPLEVRISQKHLLLYESAMRRGKEFNLSYSDVRKLLTRKTCFYTGVPFTETGLHMRTIDRIDATKGYVKGNVCACTNQMNMIKELLLEKPNGAHRIDVKHLKRFADKISNHN